MRYPENLKIGDTIGICAPSAGIVEEEKIKELSQKFTDIINNDGKVEKIEDLGKKRLAYEVKKNKEGYYLVINFEANSDLIAELERNYRIIDEVIKFITIKAE